MTAILVVTALTDPDQEAEIASGIELAPGMQLVRRCVDLADLLATTSAGSADVVVLSADLRRLDAGAIGRLTHDEVAPVVLAVEAQTERLRRLGIDMVLPADAELDQIVAAVETAAAGRRTPGPADSGQQCPRAEPTSGQLLPPGRIVAVWGPTGAPGRTTVAIGLAAQCAAAGTHTLLIDADVYGGTIVAQLGILDDVSGIAAACRAAADGRLAPDTLTPLTRRLDAHLSILAGIGRAARWTELQPLAFARALEVAAETAQVVIVDCGFCLETDELEPMNGRNEVTLTALRGADQIIVVGSADPIGIVRLAHGCGDLAELGLSGQRHLVLNRVPAGIAGNEALEAAARFCGPEPIRPIPFDPQAPARLVAGRTPLETGPHGLLRAGIGALADAIGLTAGRLERRARVRWWAGRRT